jgi:hypothetical protein
VAGASNENETEGKVVGLDGTDGGVEWTYIMPGTSVWALAQLDDVTGDETPDVIAGDFSGALALIDPTSGVPFETASVGGVLVLRFEVLEDVNGDGLKDILVAHSGSNGIVIDGTDGSNVWLTPLQDKSWCVSATNDLDGDAINDVLIGTLFSDNFAYFLNGVNGNEFESIHYGEPIDAISSIPDIVGDGSWEMVTGGRYGQIYCYSGGIDSFVGVEEQDQGILSETEYLNVYPNPFDHSTQILIELQEAQAVQVAIYSMDGKLVTRLVDEKVPKGRLQLHWDGKNNSGNDCKPGIYVIEVTTQYSRTTKKITKL